MLSINGNTKNIHYHAVLFLKHQVHECFALTEYQLPFSHPEQADSNCTIVISCSDIGSEPSLAVVLGGNLRSLLIIVFFSANELLLRYRGQNVIRDQKEPMLVVLPF